MRIAQRFLYLAPVILGLFVSPLGAQPGDQPGIQVQTRGPVHEAFAQPVGVKPEPSQPVPKEPPPPVPELPPDQRPEGDNVAWIGGYWAWDPDRQDFIWVSGMYRQTPQGRRYVPGYWTNTPEGWRWVSGFWAQDGTEEIPYAPEPPQSLENGPSFEGPEDTIYHPGYWNWRDSRFVWRPGYWGAARLGRIWVHPCYRWTPGGYLFVDGYWDYPLEDRGLLFSPVVFDRPYWRDPLWYYQPDYCVRPFSLLDALFYWPLAGHYFFGDYYGHRYGGLGFYPWFGGPYRYDPLFSYYRWHHRHDDGWYNGLRGDYEARRAGRLAPPPATLAQQTTAINNTTVNTPVSVINRQRVVTPLNQASRNINNLNLTQVSKEQRNQFQRQGEQRRELATARTQVETAPRSRGSLTPKTAPTESRTLKLPPSPRRNDQPSLAAPRPKAEPSPRPTPRAAPTPVPRAAPKVETSRPTPRPAPKVETPRPTPRAAPTPVPRAAPKVETPRPTPRAAPKVETSRPTPRAAPKVETPRPTPRAAPTPVPRAAPKVETPRPTPRAAPTPVPRAAPKVETQRPTPRAAPKVETQRPTPRAAPTPVPRAAPKVETPRPRAAPAPKAAPVPRAAPAPTPRAAPAPRVAPAPRAAPAPRTPPRVTAPPPRQNPAPAPKPSEDRKKKNR